ncbi:lamin tail domain-containing protein, partial [Candidatus Peregrinibacteria bacterium]|nr:lamin tail domain-containing protein [Candidatus Peregrinibacteria bacterium]
MLQITEIHPNPEGKDTTNEWIEITNLGPDPINLQNYTFDDEEGGSKPYTIENPKILQPNQLHVLEKSATAINLNNQGDQVRIFAPETTLETPAQPPTTEPVTSLQYGPTQQGLS